MKNNNVPVIICKNVSDKYPIVVYATNYINPLPYITKLSQLLTNKIGSKPCVILFDLLACNGDEFNRFVEIKFNGTELRLKDITIVTPDEDTVTTINKFYAENKNALDNSVLSLSERYHFTYPMNN